MMSTLSVFVVVACVLGAISIKPLPYPRSGRFMPVLSPKDFCRFNSLTTAFDYSELSFVHVVEWESSFIF